jgi:hypothetical protein
MFSLIVVFLMSFSMKGADYQTNALRLPYGKNYLDLRNIQRTDPRDIDMHTHIRIRKNMAYTLVMDLDYIGVDNFSQDEYPFFTHCEKENVNCQTKDIMVDLVNERWYYTFTSTVETLLFRNIPAMATTGYNVMLYEGTYAAFTGFEYYVSNAPIYYQGVYLMDYDQPVSEAQIRSHLSVTDPKGGPIKVDLLGGDFVESNIEIGEYILQYRAMDLMSNTSYFEMTIRVIDRTKPVIIGINSYITEHGQPLLLENIISQFTISDNVDSLSIADLTVVRDTYTPNKNQTGTYEIDFSLKDQSNNETIKTVQIQVVDRKPPVITGPDVIYTYLSDGAKTLEQIQSLYRAIDDHDGDITHKLNIFLADYDGTLIKNHTIYVRCTDMAGNETLRTVHLHVIDDTAPVFNTSDYILTYAEIDEMTHEDIVLWLKDKLEGEGVSPRHIKILLDETQHLISKRDKAYIYYSYEVDGVTHQSRIAILYPKQTNHTLSYVYAGAGIVILTGSIFLYLKVFKKHN